MDTIFFLSTLLVLAHVQCQPWKMVPTHSQACGDRLADIMSLVCNGRGYNAAFRPEEPIRRFRRGIVEECCRNSCSPDILELYCKPYPTDSPENVQIRKRSESETDSDDTGPKEETSIKDNIIVKHQQQDIEGTEDNTPSFHDNNIFKDNYITKHRKHGHSKLYTISSEDIKSEDSEPIELVKNIIGGNDNSYENKMLHSSSKELHLQHRHHKDMRTKINELSENKFIQNEAMHRDNGKTNGEVHGQIRHHKFRNHHNSNSGRSRRGKNPADENGPAFQIGTINPYFFRKSLLHPRGGSPNYFHDTISR